MKPITATFVAFTALSLYAIPLARAADNSAVEAKIKAMEDKWEAAEMEKDHGAASLADLLASDYVGVGSKGEMRNKASQLEHMKSDTDTYTSARNEKMEVHVYGSDVATAVGVSTEKGKDNEGKEFDRTYAWVDTWMQRDGKWECIASGGTPVEKK